MKITAMISEITALALVMVIASHAQAIQLGINLSARDATQTRNQVVKSYVDSVASTDVVLVENNVFSSGPIAASSDIKKLVFLSSNVPLDASDVWLSGWPNKSAAVIPTAEFYSNTHLPGAAPKFLADNVAVYVYINFKDINQMEFSDGQYFSMENFNFTKKLSRVPDPGSFFLLGLGVIALAVVRRKSATSFQ